MADGNGLPTALFAEDERPTTKHYTLGTHRICSPEDTLARVRPLLADMGITRIANVTGLDHVGIPVVMVVRPNARSVAVSQGKGLTLAAAKASGVMEAAEAWHAEHIMKPLKFVSFEEMRRAHRVADPDQLPRAREGFNSNLRLPWIEGSDLMSGEPVWVPLELVSGDLTVPRPADTGCFPVNANGLAAGNHELEAICHGLCEVVERDATTLWWLSGDARNCRAIDPLSITDPVCRRLLAQLGAADLAVRIWDITSDVGVACFSCLISEVSGEFADSEYGAGCHPVREVALLRALTEAVQTRGSFIAGARDDFPVDAWEPSSRRRRRIEIGRHVNTAPRPSTSFDTVPSFSAPTFENDLEWLLGKLRSAGFDQVIAVDLSKEAMGLPVVRVVVPGLEGLNDEGLQYTPGARARHLMARAR